MSVSATSSKTGNFRNFCWSYNDYIGRGATCNVYRGQNKKTGMPVAIKVFTRNNDNYVEEEIANQFDNEHILKIYAHGHLDPPNAHTRVAVMELCSAGDLEVILTLPKNKYGLSDKDFFLLMTCLNNGLKALREKDIVHRDIKPLNICCNISDEKKKCFKMIDLGGARVLKDGDIAMSIVGTEEFCHPQMYQRAFFEPKSRKVTYGEGTYIDLWSTGITMYKAATNSLPFQPFNYKRDNYIAKEVMLKMGTEKKDGVIAAIEMEDRSIEWQDRLPRNMNMSRSLGHLITPMLQRLIESKEANIWSFEGFFQACDTLDSYKRVLLFSAEDGITQRAYLPDITYASISKEYQKLWTPCKAGDVLLPPVQDSPAALEDKCLIFHNGHRLHQRDETKFHSILTHQNERKTVIIIVKMTSAISVDEEYAIYSDLLPTIPPLSNKLSKSVNRETLLREIREIISHLWFYQRQIKMFRCGFEFYHLTIDNLSNHLRQEMRSVLARVQQVLSLCDIYDYEERNEELKAVQERASNYIEHNIGYQAWLDKMDDLGSLPVSKMNVLKMPVVAESLLKREKDTSEMLEGHLQRVKAMYESMKEIHKKEQEHFKSLRSKYHAWVKEVYEEHIEKVKSCNQTIEISLEQRKWDVSLRSNPLLAGKEIPLQWKSLSTKFGEFNKAIMTLKSLNESISQK